MINRDPMVEHERLQATIHLMSGLVSYDVKSVYHSLVVARINEHVSPPIFLLSFVGPTTLWSNKDLGDVLFLIEHFAV